MKHFKLETDSDGIALITFDIWPIFLRRKPNKNSSILPSA